MNSFVSYSDPTFHTGYEGTKTAFTIFCRLVSILVYPFCNIKERTRAKIIAETVPIFSVKVRWCKKCLFSFYGGLMETCEKNRPLRVRLILSIFNLKCRQRA